MASRLSEESLKSTLEGGQQGFVIESRPTLPVAEVDLEALLVAEDPEAAVQSVPPQLMYQALMRAGVEDSLEVLPHLSADQVQRIFDYDTWEKDQLAPLKVARWLNLFKEVDNEQLYTRFRGLDEEYQIALIGPLIQLYDEEEYEALPDHERDPLQRLPCGTLYYRLKSPDPRLDELVGSIVEAGLGSDINYTYSLLGHSAQLPPNEAEALLAQFRRARLEEDGFVSYEESLMAFRPVDLTEFQRLWRNRLGETRTASEALPATVKAATEPFLRQVLSSGEWSPEATSAVLQGLAFLGNSLCAAAQVEPDDLHAGERLVNQAQAYVSLGLEWAANGDIGVGRVILAAEHPQLLFRVGLALVRQLAEASLAALAQTGLPGVDGLRRHFLQGRSGLLEHGIEQLYAPLLGFERTEVLKGLFNRFPLRPVTLDAVVARRGLDGRYANEWSGHADENATLRQVFAPITTRRDLAEFSATVDAVLGSAHLALLADDGAGAATESVDVRLLRAYAQALLGGTFRSVPLTSAEVDQLVAMPSAAIAALTNDLYAGIDGRLRLGLEPGASAWAPSHRIQHNAAASTDPVAGVVQDLAALSSRLQLACAHAREHGRSGASLLDDLCAHPTKET